ncbi:hypothetical protein PROFUN_13145 [Planoprotostelium fungivorum]|uniref:Uncharacterized protein n=1 Tax=Planoprotostelium fungivorum TaxID=1890364 RepID=A0A2P6N562_9EUKA|nr:hypothetical protein PROFUN_13145 [Planoprotostelium fungivorum]
MTKFSTAILLLVAFTAVLAQNSTETTTTQTFAASNSTTNQTEAATANSTSTTSSTYSTSSTESTYSTESTSSTFTTSSTFVPVASEAANETACETYSVVEQINCFYNNSARDLHCCVENGTSYTDGFYCGTDHQCASGYCVLTGKAGRNCEQESTTSSSSSSTTKDATFPVRPNQTFSPAAATESHSSASVLSAGLCLAAAVAVMF